jgi:hypothetical protein
MMVTSLNTFVYKALVLKFGLMLESLTAVSRSVLLSIEVMLEMSITNFFANPRFSWDFG